MEFLKNLKVSTNKTSAKWTRVTFLGRRTLTELHVSRPYVPQQDKDTRDATRESRICITISGHAPANPRELTNPVPLIGCGSTWLLQMTGLLTRDNRCFICVRWLGFFGGKCHSFCCFKPRTSKRVIERRQN